MAFDLSSIRKDRGIEPPRGLFYGPHGAGKTTTLSQAPNPIFLPTEEGLGNLEVDSFPLAESYDQVLEACEAIENGDHDYQSFVIDSLDWLEPLIWKHVAASQKKKTVEDLGYGKGYTFAADEIRSFLHRLDRIRRKRKIAILFTAHSIIKRYDDPNNEPYDRYTLKLHQKAADVVLEWCDLVAFVTDDMVVRKEDVGFDKTVARGVSKGRVMYLSRTPAFDAKNRYALPDKLPLNWQDLQDALTSKTPKD